MSECQAFFLLSVLCDRLLPGYYSTTMYGTLLDQKVFESLVEKTMPVLWDHLVKSDVQLSVVSLPWFLSLYINSMPLVFAFRVLDVFFLEGPKVLFQVGLAILRINGEELLDVQDDGSFISILKTYFARLDESAHPRSENPKLRAITRFQELMVVAFKEFAGITHNTITEQREKHKDAVLENIENFAKRTSIRNLGPESKKLSVDDLGAIYDRFYGVLYENDQKQKLLTEEKRVLEKKKAERISILAPPIDAEVGRVGLGPSPTHMDYNVFREFLAATARWAVADSPPPSRKQSSSEKDRLSSQNASVRGRRKSDSKWSTVEAADDDFMRRLYRKWNVDNSEGLSLQNVVVGLARLKGTRDIMNSISYFFDLYDDNGTGTVDRDGILSMSEALLFLSRRGFDGALTVTNIPEDAIDSSLPLEQRDRVKLTVEERFLGSVSSFIRRCFEYADPSHPQSQATVPLGKDETQGVTGKLDAFAIGDDDEDDEEDLLELDDKKDPPTTSSEKKSPPIARPSTPKAEGSQSEVTSPTRSASQSANAALDPNKPLHITLPTFRMVILADELLEQFFESFFPQSFHLSDHPHPASLAPSTSLSSNLTTFANLGNGSFRSSASANATVLSGATVAGASGGIVPPNKGLRGVLDNIVSDGMRMAAEVRKRMDEAQRELERNALNNNNPDAAGRRPLNRANTANTDDDDDEYDDDDQTIPMIGGISSWGAGAYGVDDNVRSRRVRERDHDLLEGAEAQSVLNVSIGDGPDAAGGDNNGPGLGTGSGKGDGINRDRHQPTPTRTATTTSEKGGSKVEFES